jgi:hypothetical protein
VQIGTSLSVGIATNTPAQDIGALPGSSIYTAISSAIARACTSNPTSGSFVTTCATPSAIPNIAYEQGGFIADGTLDVSFADVNYTDSTILQLMIAAVAAAANSTAIHNAQQVSYTDSSPEVADMNPELYHLNLSTIPGTTAVEVFQQNNETHGALGVSRLEVSGSEGLAELWRSAA